MQWVVLQVLMEKPTPYNEVLSIKNNHYRQ